VIATRRREPVERGDPQRVEHGVPAHDGDGLGSGAHQSALKCSNGSRHASHTHRALHAVEPNRLRSRVRSDPHRGHRTDSARATRVAATAQPPEAWVRTARDADAASLALPRR